MVLQKFVNVHLYTYMFKFKISIDKFSEGTNNHCLGYKLIMRVVGEIEGTLSLLAK